MEGSGGGMCAGGRSPLTNINFHHPEYAWWPRPPAPGQGQEQRQVSTSTLETIIVQPSKINKKSFCLYKMILRVLAPPEEMELKTLEGGAVGVKWMIENQG